MAFFVIKNKTTNEIVRVGSCADSEVFLQPVSPNEAVEQVDQLPDLSDSSNF